MKQFSLAVADPVYFIQYGPALVMSALETGNPLYLTVVDWGEKTSAVCNLCQQMRQVAANYSTEFQVWVTALPFNDITADRKRVFYACARYHVIDHLLETMDDVQIHSMDIDSIFMKSLALPPVKLGLYLREDENLGGSETEKRGMKVLGHTILSSYCKDYVSRVASYIRKRQWAYWFLDQEALYHSLTDADREMLWDMKGHDLIDWNFTPQGKIWSGKGPRKFNDERYVTKVKQMNEYFFNLLHEDKVLVG